MKEMVEAEGITGIEEMWEKQWKQYLLRQAKLHSSIEPQDICKLIYQTAFGAEHLLSDSGMAKKRFMKEYEEAEPENGPLYEQISDRICRVNIRVWKRKELPAEWLFRMFAAGINVSGKALNVQRTDMGQDRDIFLRYLQAARETVEEGVFGFSLQEFEDYVASYVREGLRPVHHSERYRLAERPAYRLVDWEYLCLLPILEAMDKVSRAKSTLTVAIDGRCTSGKTTLAEKLSKITGAGVIHMDDFFLPVELRTKERFCEPGGNIHYERFCEEVLPHLRSRSRETFCYRRFDCRKMQLEEECIVEGGGLRIVEGAYSLHPAFGEYADFKIFAEIDPEEQLERIRRRNGKEALSVFVQRWIPLEEIYFTACHVPDLADLIVRTDLHKDPALVIIDSNK